jgi:tyrosyl-tRNA synthetase
MQGYDSVAVKADVEIGGFDQLFNLKAGRVIQDHYGMKKQNIMTGVMLDGTDGRKMSTSWGNIITIVDEPNDMFGKLMSLRDDLIVKYFRLCTDREESFILDIENKLKEGENPRDMKMLLAEDIVTLYHNEKLATLAKNNFVETFQKGGIPDDVPEVLGADGDLFSDLALKAGAVESKTEWKRLVEDGAVSFEDGTALTDYKEIAKSCILKIGKRRFLRIRL